MNILTLNLGGGGDGVRLKLSLRENYQSPMLAEREGYFIFSSTVFLFLSGLRLQSDHSFVSLI